MGAKILRYRVRPETILRFFPFLLIAWTAWAQTPTLVQSKIWLGNGSTETGNNFVAHLNGPTGAGNLLVVFVNSPAGASSPTITDNTGSTTWINAGVSGCATTGLSEAQRKHQLFYSQNAAGGIETITIAFSSAQFNINFGIAEFYNVAASVDASVCAVQQTGPNVSSGSLTTAADGDLIVNFVDDEADGNYNDNSAISAIGLCPTCTGLYADQRWGMAGQFAIQPTHGAMSLTSTWTQGTHDRFGSLAVAFKAASAGTAPAAGIRIVRMYVTEINSTTQPFSFPCSGNLLVAESPEGTFSVPITSITSTPSHTWAAINAGGSLYAQLFHVDNITDCPAGPGMLTGTIHSSSIIGQSFVYFFDIAGAAASPVDTNATCPAPSASGGAATGSCYNSAGQSSAGQSITDAPDITPSTPNGLVISGLNFGIGPFSGMIGAGFVFDAVWNTNESDQSLFADGDGESHIYNSGATALKFQYTTANNTAAYWQAMATAFKAGATTGGQPPAPATGLSVAVH